MRQAAQFGAAAMGVAMLATCCLLLECKDHNAIAADNWMPVARIFGEEGCKDKNDFHTLKELGEEFQRALKPALQSGLMTPEKFDAMYEVSKLNRWLKQHEAVGSCIPLKDGIEIVIDERGDQVVCVRPRGENTCFWISNKSIRPQQ